MLPPAWQYIGFASATDGKELIGVILLFLAIATLGMTTHSTMSTTNRIIIACTKLIIMLKYLVLDDYSNNLQT